MPADTARFHLISGNRLDVLATHLGERLAQAADLAAADSLAPDVVLIPQPSLRHWLQQALAQRFGIAANLDLRTPSEFVWQLLRAAHPELPEVSPWDRERLRWRLYALLQTTPVERLPVPVRAYLQRAVSTGALARDELADALAGAFDKYQAYRRDWLRDWEQGVDAQDWQATLWRALHRQYSDSKQSDSKQSDSKQPDSKQSDSKQSDSKQSAPPHRAALIGDWLSRYTRGEASPPGLPPRLAAFGTIHVSPDVLRMLAVIGQWSELDFYLPTPSGEYWGDIEPLRARLRRDGADALPEALVEARQDNPLLQAWGYAGREIVAQLFAYDVIAPERETEHFVHPGRDSLLHRLQHDVLNRAAPVPETCADNDVSLQVHACHSKLREIEVLHDQLRGLLDDPNFDPPLQPHEIAVLAPDIADYLPLARAVFGGIGADDPRHIPFSLADRPQMHGHPLIGMFLQWLTLAEKPLTSSLFREWLAIPAAAQAWQLDASRLAKIDAWFAASGIRWGEDEAARMRAGVGRWREYSFGFGFDRLLSGYAAGDSVELTYGDRSQREIKIAPYPELEGADADVLDRVLVLHAELQTLAEWMRQPHTANDWQQRLASVWQTLLAQMAIDHAQTQAQRYILEALDEFASDAAVAGEIPVELVRRALQQKLSQPAQHQPWLSGGVTFAGMVPLRTVPFRVICLLGMDADAYPRRESGNDVNRLIDAVQGRAARRLGDRSVREDDRFLFLQLLCAAGEVFYLSYGGRDARDGSVREPSALIAELLETVERMHGSATRERLLLEHPLQPFSPRAFGAGADVQASRRFSYRDEWLPKAQRVDTVQTTTFAFAERPLPSRIDVTQSTPVPDRDRLQWFFENPARAWLRECVGIRLPTKWATDEDREPLGDDGLLRYVAIEALLIDDDVPKLNNEQARRRLLARGVLPPGRDGAAVIENALAVARQLFDARTQLLRDVTKKTVVSAATPLAIDFSFNDIYADQRILLTAGSLDGKRRLRAGIDHLLLASVLGEQAQTRLLGFDRQAGEVTELVFASTTCAQAQAGLDIFIGAWRSGQEQPLPFMPKAGFAYADTLKRKGDPLAAWNAALTALRPYYGRREADDPWLQLAFRPHGLLDAYDSAASSDFREIVVRVFGALSALS